MNNTYINLRLKQRYRHISLALLALSILLLVVLAYFVLERASDLVSAGWGRTLFGRSETPIGFTVKCLASTSCTKTVGDYLLDTPLVPAGGYLAASAILFGVSLFYAIRSKLVRDERDPGVAHWATRQELQPYIGAKGYLGVAYDKVLGYPKDSLFAHTLVLGQPGSGKTSTVMEPMLVKALQDGLSAIVFEQKHPNANGFPKLFPWIEEHTDAKIQVFIPDDPNTYTFPILDGAEDFDHAYDLAYIFYPRTEPGHVVSFHFESERPLLAVVMHIEAAYGSGSMEQVFSTFARGHHHLKDYLQTAASEGRLPKRAFDELQAFFNLPDRDQSSAVAGVKGKLSMFNKRVFARSVSASPRQIDVERLTVEQGLLYIGIDQSAIDLGPGNEILQLIKLVLVKRIKASASKHGRRLPVPLLFFIDEFPNLGPLPNITRNLQTMRESRVGYVIAAQALASLYETYEKETADTILANMGHIIMTYKTAPEDVVRLSRFIGKTTSTRRSTGTSGDVLAKPLEHKQMTRQEKDGDDLIRPDEFRTLKMGDAVIIGPETFPFIAHFPLLDNLHARHLGNHPATDPIFNPVRAKMPSPPRTIETVQEMLYPYMVDPELEHTLRTRVGGAAGGAEASSPPPGLRASPAEAPPDPGQSATVIPVATVSPHPPTESATEEAPAAVEDEEPEVMPRSQAVAELTEWIHHLASEPVGAKLTMNHRTFASDSAKIVSLGPKGLPLPGNAPLAAWEHHGLARVKRSGKAVASIEILPAGYKALTDEARRILSRLAHVKKLRDWVEEAGRNIVGHPRFVPRDTSPPDGKIQGNTLIVAKRAFTEQIFMGANPEKEFFELMGVDPSADVRITLGRKRRRVYKFELPPGVLPETAPTQEGDGNA